MMRGYGPRNFELNEHLQTALVNRADREQRPAEDLQAELVAAGLDHLQASDKLKHAKGKRTFTLDADLHDALLEQVGGEKGRVDELAGELLSSGLAQIRSNEGFMERWRSLSPRQKDVTGFTCLGYTNRQIAARLGIREETVKTYVQNTLVKFQLHGKKELQEALKDWDFSAWGK
jgi:DNA-binding CsgD family transcriptional regulator